jgi:hypothetical protein
VIAVAVGRFGSVGSIASSILSRAVGLVLVVCCVLTVSLFASAQALAGSPPEAPSMQCDPLVIPAGGPFVCGTLNPHSKEKLTNAYFTFSAGSTCTGGTQLSVEGEGEENIEVKARLVGIVPGTEYAFCLVAVNSSGETASSPLTFTTTAEPKAEAPAAVTTTSAILEATLEPAGDKLEYQLWYSRGSGCEGGILAAQAEGENKVSALVEGLTPNTEYTFCPIAKGHEGAFVGQGETNVGVLAGKPVHFKTLETQAEKEAWFKKFAEENARRVAEEAAVRMRHEEEASAAAAKKRQEEEIALSHKHEEEAAPKKNAAERADTGGISLAGTGVTVQSNGVALVKLECLGIADCRGKLALIAKSGAKGKKAHTLTAGTVSFSIAGDETKTVRVKLNAAGRALLSADHGRPRASLQILELAPGPSSTQRKVVRLVQQKAHGKGCAAGDERGEESVD